MRNAIPGLHQHINLPTGITTHIQPALLIKSHPHRPEAILRAIWLMRVVEDVLVGSVAVGGCDGLAVHEVDGGDFVAGRVGAIPVRHAVGYEGLMEGCGVGGEKSRGKTRRTSFHET